MQPSAISPENLHVISIISNPCRYQSRPRLFKEFLKLQAAAGVTQWVVEATFGERPPEVADPKNPQHIIVRCDDELWLKENLINVGARYIPNSAKYIMWCDADIAFGNSNWAVETIQALQHYDAVQPFSDCIDYGKKGEVLETHKGFAYCFNMGARLGPHNVLGGDKKYPTAFWHPGYAWAFREKIWNDLGGMLDKSIGGAGDHHMACAMIGKGDYSYPGNISEPYKKMVKIWEQRALLSMKKNIGYIPGTIHHQYHGAKANRKYVERWSILTENKYDPDSDVSYDRHGVLQFSMVPDERSIKLRDEMRLYFRSRDEDS